MPELPDVEVFASYLKKHALRKPIRSTEVNQTKILKNISKKELEGALKNHSFRSVKRVGKYLFLEITGGNYLVLHFGMTGFVYVFKDENPFAKHTRALFHFKGKTLAYVNQRMLGFISLIDSIESYAKNLGPDALEISKNDFRALFESGTLKATLMDQSKIAGIGNVYCDEILFNARLRPKQKSSSLSEKDIDSLYKHMRQVLKRAIDAGADIDRMPQAWLIGSRKKGAPCPRCGTPINQIKAGGRSTYFCPECQKEKDRQLGF